MLIFLPRSPALSLYTALRTSPIIPFSELPSYVYCLAGVYFHKEFSVQIRYFLQCL